VELDAYRSSPSEQQRTSDIFELLPRGRRTILEVGARDGYHTRKLTEIFDEVTALDLKNPGFEIPQVRSIDGNVTNLKFPDRSFDCVLCAEVLEHVSDVDQASREIARVARHEVLIGVPYKQDTRVGRLTCSSCGQRNPSYGHINTFDEYRLQVLFKGLETAAIHRVGSNRDRTNPLSTILMDFAGNPWGTYGQDEACIHCGAIMERPAFRSAPQRAAGRLAHILNRLQQPFIKATGNWIHLLFRRETY
jgi:ubiquinone/menaquinone biosynthesis C-methylase UbiE